jgi:hypothetical protein
LSKSVSVELERNPERRSKALERRLVELASPAAESALRDREEVVAVRDALASKPMLWPEWHLGRQVADRGGDGCDGDVGEKRDRAVTSYDDRRTMTAGEVDIVDRAAVQSGSPPSAS